MRYERTVTCLGVRGAPKYSKYPPVWVASGNATTEQRLHVTVEVKTASDAHVLLKTGRTSYEIVLGGWNNSRSEIRRGQQGTPLGQLLHKDKPLNAEFFVSVHIQIERTLTGGVILVDFPGISESLKIFDKRMPNMSEVRVASGFGFEGEWRILADDHEEEDLSTNSPLRDVQTNMALAGEGRVSDTPSLGAKRRQITPFEGVLKRPAIRTPLTERSDARSPFPLFASARFGAKMSETASVRTVLGQFD